MIRYNVADGDRLVLNTEKFASVEISSEVWIILWALKRNNVMSEIRKSCLQFFSDIAFGDMMEGLFRDDILKIERVSSSVNSLYSPSVSSDTTLGADSNFGVSGHSAFSPESLIPGHLSAEYRQFEFSVDPQCELSEEMQKIVLFYTSRSFAPHELLGVSENSDPSAVRKAFFRRSKIFHPDRYYRKALGAVESSLNQLFHAIKDAYQSLS